MCALHILLKLIEVLGRAHGPAVLAAEEGTVRHEG
jgi:hypothetical protein